jgi:hypothetical protein
MITRARASNAKGPGILNSMEKIGFTASNLRPLIDSWPKVAQILNVDRMNAVTIVERIVKRGRFTLYTEDAETGLWIAVLPGKSAEAMIDRLGCCDYAQKFFNDPTAPVDT